MNGDIRLPQPRRPQPDATRPPTPQGPVVSPKNQQDVSPVVSQEPVSMETATQPLSSRRRVSVKKLLLICSSVILLVIVATAIAAASWYKANLAAVRDNPTATHVRVTIDEGMTPQLIANRLEEKEVIRSALAFRIYTKLHSNEDKLQAGSYSLSPGASTPDIVASLTSGKVDTISITFLPGATVADDKKVLLKAGYSQNEIDTAFAKTYNHPVFVDKPASADLEGYIYGETYDFPSSATVEQILTRTFEELYAVVKKDSLMTGFKAHGLTLYQGITLASIIQREVNTSTDMGQVAQVFLLRYKEGMSLGSDVTYQYAADKLGVPRTPTLDSPYNTRIVTGLPPGPISAPGASALNAVANPAAGDYVFFLSGDDDKTYFARTQAEHEKNIVDHCEMKCQIL